MLLPVTIGKNKNSLSESREDASYSDFRAMILEINHTEYVLTAESEVVQESSYRRSMRL